MSPTNQNPYEPPETGEIGAGRPYWRRRPWRLRGEPVVWVFAAILLFGTLTTLGHAIYVQSLRNAATQQQNEERFDNSLSPNGGD